MVCVVFRMTYTASKEFMWKHIGAAGQSGMAKQYPWVCLATAPLHCLTLAAVQLDEYKESITTPAAGFLAGRSV